MKNFFVFDRRKKEDVITQIVDQFISYVHDYKFIVGTPMPDLTFTKKDLGLSDKELKKIIHNLIQKGYLIFSEKEQSHIIQFPNQYTNDFIINVAPAFREIINAGRTPKVFTLARKILTVDQSLINQFPGLVMGSQVVYFKRYLTADNTPVFYIEFCLALDHLPGVDQLIKDDDPHLEIIMNKYNAQYRFHIREFNVIHAPAAIQSIFNHQDKEMLCTFGKYRFFNGKGDVVESGFAYMTDLTEFTTTTNDLTELLI